MRILFVAPFGACRKQTVSCRLLPLAQGLAGRGFEAGVLIPAWDCPEEAGKDRRLADVHLIAPPLGPTPHPYTDILLLRALLRAARAFAPDIVHVSKGIGYAWFVAQDQMWAKKTVVLDVDDLEGPMGWGGHRSWPVRWLATWQERWLLRRAAGVTVAARALLPHVMAQPPRRDALYLPNGLHLSEAPADVAANPPVALLYTRGVDVRAERVARIWQRILERAPQARLQIVGDWRDAPNLTGCERLGWLEEPRLTSTIRTAALAFFPVADTPLIRAKSPARLLDCLAQGLPVLVNDVGEYSALLRDADPLVVNTDEEMAAKAARLLNDPAARSHYAELAWTCAQKQVWERRVDVLGRWYAQVHPRI